MKIITCKFKKNTSILKERELKIQTLKTVVIDWNGL